MKGVRNFRDLGVATEGIQKGLLYRSATPAKANSEDVKYLRNDLGLKWVLDLRSPEEVVQDGDAEIFWGAQRFDYVRKSMTNNSFTVQKTLSPTTSTYSTLAIHHITLLERRRYYFALLLKINPCTALVAIVLSLILPDYSRQIMIKEVNRGGLFMLYEIILDTAILEIGEAMQLVLKAVGQKQPILFNCKAGKDRTGLLAMLILRCAGATDEEIVADYVESAKEGGQVALGGLENKKELQGLNYNLFSQAPAEVMIHTLHYLRRKYGSISHYLEKAGFSKSQQEELGQGLRAKS